MRQMPVVIAAAFALLCAPAAAAGLAVEFDRVESLRLELPRPAITLAATAVPGTRFALACDQAPPMPERTFYPMWDALDLQLGGPLAKTLADAAGTAPAAIGDEAGIYLLQDGSGRPAIDSSGAAPILSLALKTGNNRLIGRVGTEEILSRFAGGRSITVTLPASAGPLDIRLGPSSPEVRDAARALLASCAAFHRPL